MPMIPPSWLVSLLFCFVFSFSTTLFAQENKTPSSSAPRGQSRPAYCAAMPRKIIILGTAISSCHVYKGFAKDSVPPNTRSNALHHKYWFFRFLIQLMERNEREATPGLSGLFTLMRSLWLTPLIPLVCRIWWSRRQQRRENRSNSADGGSASLETPHTYRRSRAAKAAGFPPQN